MSVHLDTDSRAEAAHARDEAEAAAERARLIRERCRSLLAAQSSPAPRTPRTSKRP